MQQGDMMAALQQGNAALRQLQQAGTALWERPAATAHCCQLFPALLCAPIPRHFSLPLPICLPCLQAVSLDVVERLMEETADLAEQQRRVQQLMGEHYVAGGSNILAAAAAFAYAGPAGA